MIWGLDRGLGKVWGWVRSRGWGEVGGSTNLETCRHPLLETLCCLGIGQTHILILLLQIGPVLHHAGDLLAMGFLKALLGFLCLEYVLFFLG